MKMVGGRLCLDFVNTVGGRKPDPSTGAVGVAGEKLVEYDDLAAWGLGAGLFTEAQARALAREAAQAREDCRRCAGPRPSASRGDLPNMQGGHRRAEAARVGHGRVERRDRRCAPARAAGRQGRRFYMGVGLFRVGARLHALARGRFCRRVADRGRPRAIARVRGRKLRLAVRGYEPQSHASVVRYAGLRQPRQGAPVPFPLEKIDAGGM